MKASSFEPGGRRTERGKEKKSRNGFRLACGTAVGLIKRLAAQAPGRSPARTSDVIGSPRGVGSAHARRVGGGERANPR